MVVTPPRANVRSRHHVFLHQGVRGECYRDGGDTTGRLSWLSRLAKMLSTPPKDLELYLQSCRGASGVSGVHSPAEFRGAKLEKTDAAVLFEPLARPLRP